MTSSRLLVTWVDLPPFLPRAAHEGTLARNQDTAAGIAQISRNPPSRPPCRRVSLAVADRTSARTRNTTRACPPLAVPQARAQLLCRCRARWRRAHHLATAPCWLPRRIRRRGAVAAAARFVVRLGCG